jgi:hypothetical protein
LQLLDLGLELLDAILGLVHCNLVPLQPLAQGIFDLLDPAQQRLVLAPGVLLYRLALLEVRLQMHDFPRMILLDALELLPQLYDFPGMILLDALELLPHLHDLPRMILLDALELLHDFLLMILMDALELLPQLLHLLPQRLELR